MAENDQSSQKGSKTLKMVRLLRFIKSIMLTVESKKSYTYFNPRAKIHFGFLWSECNKKLTSAIYINIVPNFPF